nr:MAG TPA: Head fiber protein [Caudoviricetes sp.]
MEREYISKDNLSKFASLVKGSINTAQSTANTAKTNAANAQKTADNAVTAAAGALAEAKKKVAAVKTINNVSLVGSGNLTLGDLGIDTTLCEVVTALPDAASAKGGRIYLVKSAASGTDNVYKEYVRLSKNEALPSGQAGLVFYWEQLGEWKANVDLSPYAKKTDLTKSAVGLGNVDNTSDTNKPISTATQAALNNKVDKVSGKGLSTNDFTAAYKTKLDGITAGANKYSLPTATEGALGGVRAKSIGTPISFDAKIQDTVISGFHSTTAKSDRLYPVELFYNGRAFVNVPWTDSNTTYGVATTSNNGLMSSTDKTKLDGIAAGANKTVVDTVLNPTSTNPLQNKVLCESLNAMQDTIDGKVDSSEFTDLTDTDITTLWNNAK